MGVGHKFKTANSGTYLIVGLIGRGKCMEIMAMKDLHVFVTSVSLEDARNSFTDLGPATKLERAIYGI